MIAYQINLVSFTGRSIVSDLSRNSIQTLVSKGWKSAEKWIASEQLRKMRAVLFQVYVLLALLAFSGLAMLANTFPVFQPDVLFTKELQTELPSWFSWVMQAVSWPGYTVPSIIITGLVVLYLAIIGLRWESISVLFAAAFTFVLNYLVKVTIRRPRPTEDLVQVFRALTDFSFPSGHVMYYTAFFGFLLFLTFTLMKRSYRRVILSLLLMILISLVGISRMYLGEHWASDVIGGYLLGSLALALSIQVYRVGKERQVVNQPIAVTGAQAYEVPTRDENNEIQQTLKNPLLPQKDIDDAKHLDRHSTGKN